MSAPAVSPSETLRPDEKSLAAYTAISRSAVLALALGMASSLVLVSPLLLVLPLAAVGTAALALRQISVSEGRLLGRWPATIGLCLAMLFLGWGFSREWSRNAMLAAEGRQLADQWLAIVRTGALQQADQFRRGPLERLTSEEALAEYYQSNKEAGESLKSLFGSEPLKSFRELGSGVSYRFKGVAAQSRAGFSDEVVLEYVFGNAAGAEDKPLFIGLARAYDPTKRTAGWRVTRVDPVSPLDMR